eukprot:gene11804-25_t
MPSPAAPCKVVFQNKASSVHFGPLECNTPQAPIFSEAFIWEQLLGTSDNDRRKELVSEMIQVLQTGEEWRQAVPMVTLVTPRPVAIRDPGSASRTDSDVAVNSCQLRLLTMMSLV